MRNVLWRTKRLATIKINSLRRLFATTAYRLCHRRIPKETSRELYPVAGFAGVSWKSYDEQSDCVKHRWAHRAAIAEGASLSVPGPDRASSINVKCSVDNIAASAPANGADRWIYLYLNPTEFIWRDFVWRFTACRRSLFRELQFGFRYKDFYNRYRFRHEDGHFFFDKVINGKFLNGLARTPFNMDLGRDYQIEIHCNDYEFVLVVDNCKVLSYLDCKRCFAEGSIAIIFWENNGRTDIDCEVSDIRVLELRPKQSS